MRDLDDSISRYRALGFDARPGGRHTGHGTHNAIVRFGLDYLELISVYDEDEARRAGRADLVDYLRERQGLVAYALATDDIAGEAARLRAAGLSADGPFAMERLRPDGSRLSWRLVIPGATAYRRAWPFFIQWDQSDDERLARDGRGEHANGATAIATIDVGVDDLRWGIHLHEDVLGLPRVGEATFDVGGVSIALMPRTDPDDGPTALAILTTGSATSIPPSAAAGARLRLVTT